MTAVSSKLSPKEMEAMRVKDHRMVKGTFRNLESKGGSLTFTFRKWKGDQPVQYNFVDGHHYEVPLMVAVHLRDNCYVPEHTRVLDANGRPTTVTGKKRKRFTFEALSFDSEEKREIPFEHVS